jgi:hypothetical protein
MDTGRVLTEGEWSVIRAVADNLEYSHGWHLPAAQRLRFVLDFAYGTGLRVSELVGATLGQIETDAHGDHWLKLVGKGNKAGKVALPSLAKSALDHSLMKRFFLTGDGHRKGIPGYSGKAVLGQFPLDEAHACHTCSGARSRADHRTRQFAVFVGCQNHDLPAHRRSQAGQTNGGRVCGAVAQEPPCSGDLTNFTFLGLEKKWPNCYLFSSPLR